MDKPQYDRAAAIAYDEEGAPNILASGNGAFARQILEMAFAHNIPVREDADLAEILTSLEPDCAIPPVALGALGEILTYLLWVNMKKTKIT